jgi:hypothetical protein
MTDGGLSRFDRKIAVDRLFHDCTSKLWQELHDQMNLVADSLREEYGHHIDVQMNDHNSVIRAEVKEEPESAYRLRYLEIRLDEERRRVVALRTQRTHRHGTEKGEPSAYTVEPDIERGVLYFSDSKQSLTARTLAQLLLAEKLLLMEF